MHSAAAISGAGATSCLMNSASPAAVIAATLALSACVSTGELPTPAANSTQQAASLAPSPAPIDLPCIQTTHGCTAINPDVTQANIRQTICVSGYTRTVRPATAYTNGVKAKLMSEAGLDSSRMSDYELDHIIPLAVGGHPRKLSNLQLQPWYGQNSALEKDGLERRLQHMVCKGRISLIDAQHCIAENWQACETDIAAGRIPSGGRVITQSVSGATQ
jgi:hypothetical protein